MNNYFSNIKEIYDSVGDLLEKGLPEEALNRITGSSPEIKNQTIITYLMGVCYQETGHYDQAEESFRRVIQQDPGFISAAEALIYMNDNHLSDGEKRYLCELISMAKPDSQTLKEIRQKLLDVEPVFLSDFVPSEEEKTTADEKPDFVPDIVPEGEEEISLDDITPQSPISDEDFIFKPVSEPKSEQSAREPENPEEEAGEDIDLTGKEGDLKKLFDSLNAASEMDESKDNEPEIEELEEEETDIEEPITSIENIHLSPEEEAELEREDEMEDVELLSASEEGDKLKDLLRTLHERKQKDIEEEDTETGNPEEENDDVAGPFDTLTMARVYLKQGAYSSALRILKLLKKNETDSDKLIEIDMVMKSALEGLKTEKSEKK
jgi:tetratricopeptide (TPR) repeat protein